MGADMSMISAQCDELRNAESEMPRYDGMDYEELVTAAQFSWMESARLRELVRRYVEYTSQDRCEGCVCKSRCNDGDVDECWQLTEIRRLARELGIEAEDA